MSDPLDVDRNLDHCMKNIMRASEVMAYDVHDAAMRLGAAQMMLASATHLLHKQADARARAQTRPDTGADATPRRGPGDC